MTALLVIAILVLLIVVHELGHFLAAKLFGIKVQEFGVGYPPRALLLGRIKETEYTINWIPFGGFVRLFGDEGESERGKGSFIDSARRKQALVLVAGVVMNAIAAWVLFAGAYTIGYLHTADVSAPGVKLLVTGVVADSPANAAGLKAGDEIIAVEDERTQLVTLTPESVRDFASDRGGKEIVMTYVRAGATSTALMRPAHAVVEESAGRPAVGIGLALITSQALSPGAAMSEASSQTIAVFKRVGSSIWHLFKDTLRGKPNLEEIVGPVGLVSVVEEASQSGWGYVLTLAGFISVNLAIINLIPIPALDGGRLLVVGIESIMRRRAPKLAMQIMNALGVALVIMLMVTVTYNDIARLF